MSYFSRKPKRVLSMTNIDKDVMTFDGHRVKLTRITSLKDLKGGKRYFRFGVGYTGNIIHSDLVIIGQAFGYRSKSFDNKTMMKIKTINGYGGKGYESDYFVDDLGLGNRYGVVIYEHNAKTERLLNYICDQGKVEEALKLTRGFNFDVESEICEMKTEAYLDRQMHESYYLIDDDREQESYYLIDDDREQEVTS